MAKTSERIDGKTPAGGAYSVANYFDKLGRPAPKGEAVAVEICEYAEDGTLIHRTYGEIGPTGD